MSRGWGSTLAVVAVLAVGSGRAEVVDRIIATVDGDPITAHELRQFREERATADMTDKQLLDALITDKLLEKEVREKGVTVKTEDIDRYVDQVKARNRIDDYRFEAALEAQGLTLERYRDRIRLELEKSQLVNREIRGRVGIPPDEIERYYEAHREDYRTGDRVVLRDIAFRVEVVDSDAEIEHIRRKAEEVRQLAVGGRDFASLAKQFSEGPGADKGGLLGTFARGELEPDLEQAAFALQPGQLSGVIRTDKAFHLLRVDKFEPPGYRPLEQVKDQIRDTLYDKAIGQRFEDWLSKELRERHSVEVFN
jgi:peptidyl-prolyl cis-trans isomerase SurA